MKEKFEKVMDKIKEKGGQVIDWCKEQAPKVEEFCEDHFYTILIGVGVAAYGAVTTAATGLLGNELKNSQLKTQYLENELEKQKESD